MANANIGVKSWRNYSSFSLFASGSQRADKQTSLMVDTYFGNFTLLATDWNMASRIPCSIARSYNHLDDTSGVDRPFGPEWTWDYDQNLTGDMTPTTTGDKVTWKSADGSEYEFEYSATTGKFTSPAGLHDVELTYVNNTGSPDEFNLTIGILTYNFMVADLDGTKIARLLSIKDAYGNGLMIDRDVDVNDEPVAQINYIKIRYYDSSTGWSERNAVQPTYNVDDEITKLRILYHDGSSYQTYIDIDYTYSLVASDNRLTLVTPKDSSGTSLDMEIAYGYNSTSGNLEEVYDTNGYKETPQYNWTVNYTSDKVSSIVFPIDSSTTGTISYGYSQTKPTNWPDDPGERDRGTTWSKVTDAASEDWYYRFDANGRVVYSLDPLWNYSSHDAYDEYTYNDDHQITEFSAPKPNNEAGRLSQRYFYNADKRIEVSQDAYGFLTFYKYGDRLSYSATGTGPTIYDGIGVFTPKPNQKAYSDSNHTLSETAAPLSPSISSVEWNEALDLWYYIDGSSPSPKDIELVLMRFDYQYETGTGKLEQTLSCDPENFVKDGQKTDATDVDTYALTDASACICQVYGNITSGTVPSASITVTNGDTCRTYTPRQFKDSSLKWTAYANDDVHGNVTEFECADSLSASAGKKTKMTYNEISSKVLKVQQPMDNTNQWEEAVYDGREFQLGSKKPDIGSWGVTPQTSISKYDWNGNNTESYIADPDATGTRWNGIAANGYDEVAGVAFDRLNRPISSYVIVDWEQGGTPETLTSKVYYNANGNVIRTRGPGYADGQSTKYTYTFSEYDDGGRPLKSYVPVASTNDSLTAVPTGTPFSLVEYDLVSNITKAMLPLYDGSQSTTNYATIATYDWYGNSIKTSQGWTNYTPAAANRVAEQHFGPAGNLYWTADALGYKHYPEVDDNNRLIKMHRGSATGESDETVYDYNGNVLYYYSYEDVNTDDKAYRMRNKYDLMDRPVNSGRERNVEDEWVDWNSNTSDAEFNYNQQVTKQYDKVNTTYAEMVYDNWGQVTHAKAPAVDNPSGTGTITYESENRYNVLGQLTAVFDHEDNETNYTYDVLGRMIKVNDSENNDSKRYFDARGNLWKVLAATGAELITICDERGQVVKTQSDHDSTTDEFTYDYDDNGNQTETTLPDGGINRMEYDELGRCSKTEVLQSGTDYLETTYEYNDNDALTKVTLPGGYTLQRVYNSLGNLTTSTDTNGYQTTYTYDKDNRQQTVTAPSGMVTTNTFDWKTGQLASAVYEINGTATDDITVSYEFDDNGQMTALTDGRGYTWSKEYDQMGRMTTLTTPNAGSGSYSHDITYDGNSNIIKTVDFKNNTHYYKYDGLNRMTGNGTSSTANDQTYTMTRTNELTGYTDTFGTASISYDDLGRKSSVTDSNGNQVQYEYDSLGRVTKVTPSQGADYRTEYQYTKNGSLSKTRVYDGGTSADTDYAYSSTTGRLARRDFPADASGNFHRMTYSYDSGGRVEYETLTRETGGGSTNLSRTNYAHSFPAGTYHRQKVRTEQNYTNGSWLYEYRVTYRYDGLGRQDYEMREDWDTSLPNPAWAERYETTQAYDKNSNRTNLHRNVTSGYTSDYGRAENLFYTYDNLNRLTGLTDTDDANYSCTFTCDANGNITGIEESSTVDKETATLTTSYTFDNLNRLTRHETELYDSAQGDTQLTQRDHGYNATGELTQSGYRKYWESDTPPGFDELEHVYSNGKLLQNTNAEGDGEVWHWAGRGAQNTYQAPLKSPQPDTAGASDYNVANAASVQSQMLSPDTTAAQAQRNATGQGGIQAKASSGSGSGWATGTQSDSTAGNVTVESRVQFEGTVAPTDLDRATDARQKFRIGIFGTSSMYAGASARVTSEQIGRDLNPLGRGDGQAYVGGALNLGVIRPALPLNAAASGTGNSVNNDPQVGLNELEIAENPEGTGPDMDGPGPAIDAEPMVKPDLDQLYKMFEVPEMDEETRWLYAIGILGGPQSPYSILPAMNPEAEAAWQYFEMIGTIFHDALLKFLKGEYNELQAQAYIFIGLSVILNHFVGLPLTIVGLDGGLTPLGWALLALEKGELPPREITKLKQRSDQGSMEDPYKKQEREQAEWTKREREYWKNYNAEKNRGYMMKVQQERLMNPTLNMDAARWKSAAGEVAREIWNSTAGVVVGIVVGVAVGISILATGGLSAAVILTALAAAANVAAITNIIVGSIVPLREAFGQASDGLIMVRSSLLIAGAIAEVALLADVILMTAYSIRVMKSVNAWTKGISGFRPWKFRSLKYGKGTGLLKGLPKGYEGRISGTISGFRSEIHLDKIKKMFDMYPGDNLPNIMRYSYWRELFPHFHYFSRLKRYWGLEI